ncbi:hypothetical protein Cob_v005431 [Colletotrichum orbiculare MAFF 240422]|uniref:Uncharacterized protein n=1 Tax=Colletotrichum orbiculare (strain 104-T / ATCC 96160 / CBS 514.97 / LARS 414 / MAFF 240422) TaxID=1213857 RepID=A0A484FVP6_COLOR|nr:hypothetical protein Cob_v005431 [Colletotrichum orbiculare MAFF 240422]
MMTKPALQPVPVEHNSSILHLLEGYWTMQEQLKSAEQALAKERETKERILDDFTKMAAEWEGKEAGFRAEIKRMELVLAKVTPEGVGAVVLARSGSVLDRSRRSSKMFKSMFRVSGSPEKGQNSKITKTFDESLVSTHSGSLLGTHKTILTMRPVLDRNADVELSEQFRVAREKQNWPTGPIKPGRLSVDAERKAKIEEKNLPTEHQYTKLYSAALESSVDRSQMERLLERCPSNSEAGKLASSRPAHEPSKPCRRQREFSFNPGEDGILLLPMTGVARFGDRRSTKETGRVDQTVS